MESRVGFFLNIEIFKKDNKQPKKMDSTSLGDFLDPAIWNFDNDEQLITQINSYFVVPEDVNEIEGNTNLQELGNNEQGATAGENLIEEIYEDVEYLDEFDANFHCECCQEKVHLNCSICLESCTIKNPQSTKCGHIFCLKCITQAVNTWQCCPVCREGLTLMDMHPIYF